MPQSYMPHRSKITEMFSTFAQFNSDNDAKWVIDNKLRRSIENCRLKSSAPESEQYWSLFWYKIWRENPKSLAFMHLSAYLQEPCYWAAKKTMEKFSTIQYGLVDYFQMGIAEVEKICDGFKPEKSSNLKAYAVMAFPTLFKDILRRRHDTDICTNYALLRKVSKKVFVEALNSAGLTPEEITRYKLAWKCFQALYVQQYAGGMGRLPEPDQELWSKMANLYNKERQSQLVSPGKELDSETLKQWLNQAAVRIRSYLYPKIDSLDVPAPGSDALATPEPELTSESLMTKLMVEENIQERQNQREGIYNFLLGALKQLAPDMQEVLHMYYKQDLTQKEIAQRISKEQVWVSRRLNKTRETLLKELTKWQQESQRSQGMNVSSDVNQLKNRSIALEEWLRVRDWSLPK